MTPRPARTGDDAGSYSLELAVGWGVFVLALAVLGVAAQVQHGRSEVRAAAREAARAASLATSPAQATETGRAQALASLAPAGCAGGGSAEVDVSDFRPGGYIVVTVRCDLDPLLGPASTIETSADEVVDRYRGGLRTAP